MSEPVKLLLPAEDAYVALAVELARKYVEIAGGSATDAGALAASASAAIAQVRTGAAPLSDLAIEYSAGGRDVEIHVQCGGRKASATQALPERKSS